MIKHTYPDGSVSYTPDNAKRKPRLSTTAIYTSDPQRCQHDCPGGSRCCLDRDRPKEFGKGARLVRHTLHICRDENCVCHSAERYGGRAEG